MSENLAVLKLPVETPRRKGAKTKLFYDACAIDGKFSPRCTSSKYMRPHAKRKFATRAVADRKILPVPAPWIDDGELNARISFKKRVELKTNICQYHRETDQVQMSGNKGHEVLGPTTALQLEAECLEPILWKSEPQLRINLQTPDNVAIGTAFHDTASQYFKNGRLQMLGRYGLNATVALMPDHPDDVGLTYPLRIDPEMKVGALKAQLFSIRRRTERLLRQAVKDQVLRSKYQIFQDQRVIWATVDHRLNIPLSTLMRGLFGFTGVIEPEFDPVVSGELDLVVTSWPTDKGELEVVIDDYKTLPDKPSKETIDHYRQSIQMPIYGALMDWSHQSDWEEMPRPKIRTRYQLIWDTGTYTLEVPYNREIALEALRRYYRFKPYLAEARKFGVGRSFREVADKFFPAVANDQVCPNCFAFGVCTLTRPTDKPMSYLDQVMPTRKERQKGLNMPLWDQK